MFRNTEDSTTSALRPNDNKNEYQFRIVIVCTPGQIPALNLYSFYMSFNIQKNLKGIHVTHNYT